MAGYPTLTYPDLLENSTREELEQILSLLQGYLSTEHKDDGTHDDVTADSVTVSGDVTIADDLTASGTITAVLATDANVKAMVDGSVPAFGRDAQGPGLTFNAAAADRMAIVVSTAVGGPQMKFVDRDSATASYIMRLYLAAAGRYTLSPSVAMTVGTGVDLGADASGERFNNIYGENIRANTALFGPITHLTGTVSPAQITSDQNNYNPANLATASHLRLSVDAARTITGIAAQTHGRLLMLSNSSNFNITLADQSASSTAGNRFACANATNVTVRANNGSVLLRYDSSIGDGFWFVLGA